MSASYSSGRLRIISLTKDTPPTGIDFTKPASQTVRLSDPVQVWTLKKDGDTFRLSLNEYPYTGVIGNKVTVSTNPEHDVEWRAIYKEYHSAYIIERADNSSKELAWTVSPDHAGNPVIEIKPIEYKKRDPKAPTVPQNPKDQEFLPSQLFLFVKAV